MFANGLNQLVQNEIIRLAAEAGAKAAMDTMEKEKKKAQKSRYDRRLRNTKLLLRNYRMFEEHTKNAVVNVSDLDENAIDILDRVYEYSGSELYVESIKNSVVRTTIILTHIKEMLILYETYCMRSSRPEDQRRYRIIESLYITDMPLTIKEVAKIECIDERTVYKDIDAACEKLSALIFGIDGMRNT
ncbi:hypothetical protein [uncultured Tissierella sp.]|uniref:hypothetical protein n=1 Tax=uncultured Tissierella sp. TaxID=448160 RepID=UPI002803F8FB|nr:hypothetical protein [uncultured Tissierella sp.]MDU5080250.1 hypothetical protein [Bacillota bacterium]